MVDGAETTLTLCQLQSLTKYIISVSAITTTTTTGAPQVHHNHSWSSAITTITATGAPQVLGSPRVVSFWTTPAERPARPTVMSVTQSTATVLIQPVENLVVAPVIARVKYTLMLYNDDDDDRPGAPVISRNQQRVVDGVGWHVGSRLSSEKLNRPRIVQLDRYESLERVTLNSGTTYYVSLVALIFMVDGDVIFAYSWPPVSFTTSRLTTSTQTTSTDPYSLDSHSTSTDIDAAATAGHVNEKDVNVTSSAVICPYVSSFANSTVSETPLTPVDSVISTSSSPSTSSSSSSSSSSSLTASYAGSFSSVLLVTSVHAHTETATEKSSSLSSYFAFDSSTAATQTAELTSANQRTTKTTVSSTILEQSSAFRPQMTTDAAERVTSSTTTDATASQQILTTDLLTSRRRTIESVVATNQTLIIGEKNSNSVDAPVE